MVVAGDEIASHICIKARYRSSRSRIGLNRNVTMAQIDDLLLSFGVTSDGTEKVAPTLPKVPEVSDTNQTPSEVSSSRTRSNPETGSNVPRIPVTTSAASHSEKIEAARANSRINQRLVSGGVGESKRYQNVRNGLFFPYSPDTLEQAGVSLTEVSNLILKFLYSRGVETGFRVAMQLGLKFPLIEAILRQLKIERLVGYKNSIAGGDYLYELTDLGRECARTLTQQSTYFGTAPVPLELYIDSVTAQSIADRKPSLEAIRRAFSDLDINERMLSNIGQAIHSGRGMFLYGPPGNGKTSMAERVTKSFGDSIWIPKAIVAGGEVLRMYDPNRHRIMELTEDEQEAVDGRWVKIERPTIVAGGELTMENLEITYIRKTGVGEAPLQMKSNCGTLLIDDFGRQRMSTDELLNRWIVPLEQRIDFLHMESGRTIQVPFDQLIIFSSNLEPRDLVDDAFLRRIPYKIHVLDAEEGDFRNLFIKLARKGKFACTPEVVDYLIQQHYVAAHRPFRYCHPRDLLRQIENRSTLHNLPREITKDAIDQAVENYFSIM